MIIGYTTGVYDLFHIGHLNLLKRAKDHCDFLIVGVTTDELSTSIKGKTPIIPYNERAAIIEAIRYVDLVVPQYTYDKKAAWEEYQFHKMFVGDDWKDTEKWIEIEHKFKKIGVEIIYFPYTKHISTTKLRGVMKNTSKAL